MTKLKRKDTDRLRAQLDDVIDVMTASRIGQDGRDGATHLAFKEVGERLTEHGATLAAIRRDLSQWRAGMDLERIEALLNGVKAALERMGGTALPSAVADIHALRDQVAEFRNELEVHKALLMQLARWLDAAPKRRSRKKVSLADPKGQKTYYDVAPHNEPPEVAETP